MSPPADPPTPAAPIFVVGYMHSGTTLLHNILAGNQTVYAAADETRYFAYLPLLSGLYPDLSDEGTLADLIVMLADLIERGDPARLRDAPPRYRPPDSSLGDDELARLLIAARREPDFGAVFRLVFDHLAHRAGKTRWLEKTPQHVFLVDDILRAVPEALFIEITRDPRDILASKKKRQRAMQTTTQYSGEQKRIKTLERAYHPFWEALEWQLALRAGQQARQRHPDRVCTLRYEDLVAEPEVSVQGVCTFLGLDFSPAMLDVRWWNTAEGDRSQQKGIVAAAVGRWPGLLGPGEVALCQWIGGAQFARAGYQRAPVTWSGRLRVPWLLVRAGVQLVDRLVRRWRLGGFGFLMNTLRNYGKELRKLLARR
jgi:hypothetical protein